MLLLLFDSKCDVFLRYMYVQSCKRLLKINVSDTCIMQIFGIKLMLARCRFWICNFYVGIINIYSILWNFGRTNLKVPLFLCQIPWGGFYYYAISKSPVTSVIWYKTALAITKWLKPNNFKVCSDHRNHLSNNCDIFINNLALFSYS